LSAVDSPMNLETTLECDDQKDDDTTELNLMNSEITREQLLKEAPQLIEYAILRGWISKPKRKADEAWHCSKSGHLDDASDDEIQELRKQLSGS